MNQKRFLIIVVLGLILFSISASAIRYNKEGIIGGLGGRYGLVPTYGAISNIYSQYSSWFDFFIFLMIFLGIAYGVLGQHFKEGTKMVVVGVGLALAFGLLLWEEQTGFSIIGSLGPFVAILLVFLLAMSFFYLLGKFAHFSGRGVMIAIGVSIFIFWFFFSGMIDYYGWVIAYPSVGVCNYWHFC